MIMEPLFCHLEKYSNNSTVIILLLHIYNERMYIKLLIQYLGQSIAGFILVRGNAREMQEMPRVWTTVSLEGHCHSPIPLSKKGTLP